MNRKKLFILSAVILVVITTVLLYNKSRMEARSRPLKQTAIPVTVVKVEKMKLTEQQSFVGTIAAHHDVAIVSETQGKVVAVYAEVGDRKPAGAVLIEVDDELKRAADETAEVNYEKAKKDFERIELLHQEHSATDQQYESARFALKAAEAQYITARRQYNDTKIKTPIGGIVTSRPVDVGTMVHNGMVVANVVDISKLNVRVNVPEKEVFKLRPGDKVDITTDVYRGITFEGTISSISSKADEAHTYPVEITMRNSPEHPLKAGMFGRVVFRSFTDGEVLSVPRRSLVGSVKKPQVFVVEHQTAKLRDLIVGSEVGNAIVVLSGLKESDTVVVSGHNNLKDGSPVTIIK
jgi:RND family efflux transporter MFP subunit